VELQLHIRYKHAAACEFCDMFNMKYPMLAIHCLLHVYRICNAQHSQIISASQFRDDINQSLTIMSAAMSMSYEAVKLLPSDVQSMYTSDLINTMDTLLAKTNEPVSTWEEIRTLLMKISLASVQQVAPEYCGVHAENRSSHLVEAVGSQHHGHEILKAGFSWAKAADATASQAPPPGMHQYEQHMKANNALVQVSHGMIPPLKHMQIISLGSSFTNTFLRQCKGGVKSAVAELADDNGNLNMDVLGINREAFKTAVDKGLFWTIVHWSAFMVWPKLADLIQRALNTSPKGEISEIEVMLWMNRKAKALTDAGASVDWVQVETEASSSLPSCSPWINEISKYVQDKTNGELLNELSLWQKAVATLNKNNSKHTRLLGGQFIQKLNQLNFGNKKFPYVSGALIKANLMSPSHKIIDGLYKLLKPSDVLTFSSKNMLVQTETIDKVMEDARGLCKQVQIGPIESASSIGMLDVRLIMFSLNRMKDIDVTSNFESVDMIAEAIYRVCHT
jgi:hypothetical protein